MAKLQRNGIKSSLVHLPRSNENYKMERKPIIFTAKPFSAKWKFVFFDCNTLIA